MLKSPSLTNSEVLCSIPFLMQNFLKVVEVQRSLESPYLYIIFIFCLKNKKLSTTFLEPSGTRDRILFGLQVQNFFGHNILD